MASFSSPAARVLALGILSLLLLPLAQAQLPTVEKDAVVSFALVCEKTLIEVDYQGTAQSLCTLYDLTHDYAGSSVAGQRGVGAISHYTILTLGSRFPSHAQGWNVILGAQFIPTYGGDVVTFPITVQTTPLVNTQDYEFEVIANYTGPNDEKLNQTIYFHAEVNEYDIAFVETANKQQKAGQDEIVKYVLRVSNLGVYPDVYQISVTAASAYRVSVPPNVYVPPGETRNVTVSLLTPKGKLYELGKSEAFIFKVSSTRGTGVYTTVGLLSLRGPYVPVYWVPLLTVVLIAAAVATTKAQERTEIRRLERGRPRRVALTPRQAVLLDELRKADPETYKERKAQLAAVYAARRAEYRTQHKERMRLDAEERKLATAEFKAAKKQRAQERKEQQRLLKLGRTEDALRRKAEKKEMKQKTAELRKKQKLLEKAQKKQAKVDAKLAARVAKEQAKADRLAAKEAKRAAKAAKKRPPEGNA